MQPSRPDVVKANIEVYDQIADHYRADRGTYLPVMRDAMWPFLERLKEYGAKHILDIGSGAGVHTQILTEAGFQVTAIDAAPAMLKIVQDNVPQARCIVANFWDFDGAGQQYDAVVLASFVHLFPKQDFHAAMARIRSWLKPSAIGWFATVTGQPNDGEWLAKEEANRGGAKRWRVVYDLPELRRMMDDANIKIVQELRLPDAVHGHDKQWIDLVLRWGSCPTCHDTGLQPMYGGAEKDGNFWAKCDDCGTKAAPGATWRDA